MLTESVAPFYGNMSLVDDERAQWPDSPGMGSERLEELTTPMSELLRCSEDDETLAGCLDGGDGGINLIRSHSACDGLDRQTVCRCRLVRVGNKRECGLDNNDASARGGREQEVAERFSPSRADYSEHVVAE